MLSTSEFASKIAWFRAELRDLKTAHQRGLGLLDFFSSSATFVPEQFKVYQVVVTVAQEFAETFPPIIQLAVSPIDESTGFEILRPAFDETNLTFTAILGGNWSADEEVTVQVTSSAKISSVVVEEYNA